MSYYMEVSSCPTLPLSWVSNCPVSKCPVSSCPVSSCPSPEFWEQVSSPITIEPFPSFPWTDLGRRPSCSASRHAEKIMM